MNAELVRRAAADHFAEGFMYGEMQRILENTPAEMRVEAYERMRPQRTVPDGCFAWISHLIWIENLLEVVALPLNADEAEGLVVLKRERIRFQNSHPACFKCGMPNEETAFRCRECGVEIQR